MPSPETLGPAQRFFRKAGDDCDAVEILCASGRAPDAVVGFQAQQALEKLDPSSRRLAVRWLLMLGALPVRKGVVGLVAG